MRLLSSALLLAALAVASAQPAAADPPPKGAAPVALRGNVKGDTLTVSWTWRAPGLSPTDTGYVTWWQKSGTFSAATQAVTWGAWVKLSPVNKTRGTSWTRAIALPAAAGQDSVYACIVQHRPAGGGWPATDSPAACTAKRGRAGPPLPPAGADSATLSFRYLRVPTLLPAVPVVRTCPAGWSCPPTAYVAPTLPRFRFVRSSSADTLQPNRFSCNETPAPVGPGLIAVGCTSWEDAQRLAVAACVAAVRADGRITWTFTSAAQTECRTPGVDSLMAQAYGAAWHPELFSSAAVTFTVLPTATGFKVVVEDVADPARLSLSLALR